MVHDEIRQSDDLPDKETQELTEEKPILNRDDGKPEMQCSYTHIYTIGHKCELPATHNNKSNKPLCILHSRDKKKDQVFFDETLDKYIRSTREEGNDFHLEGVIFIGEANFSRHEFKNAVFFNDCTFYSKASFNNAKFLQNASFRSCKFYDEASFNSASFYGKTDFKSALFYSNAIFQFTEFNLADNDRNNSYFEFINVYFLKPEIVLFKSVDFSKVLLTSTNINKVRIINSKWPVITKTGGTRLTIADEIKYSESKRFCIEILYWRHLRSSGISTETKKILFGLRNVERFVARSFSTRSELASFIEESLEKRALRENDLELIIRYCDKFNFFPSQLLSTFSQLKENYEDSKRYIEANDFYYGEMEYRYGGKPYQKYLPTAANIYKITSGYGQRYIRSLFVLFLLIASFACSHMLLGLKPNESKLDNFNYSEIGYSKTEVGLRYFGKKLFLSVVYCIEVLMREPEKDRIFKSKSIFGDSLNIVFTILIYLQTVFFTLSLRLHFKR